MPDNKEPEIIYNPATLAEMSRICEASAAYNYKRRIFTIDDILALPEGVRAELIDGQIYFMATPTRTHQKIAGEMHYIVKHYIKTHGGACEAYIPPFAVYLNADDSIYVEPDLVVICDTDKLNEKGCHGAPDWVVEVLSPSSKKLDQFLKLQKYRAAGVREYWIIDPEKRIITVHLFEDPERVDTYSFEDNVPSGLYPDLFIRMADSI